MPLLNSTHTIFSTEEKAIKTLIDLGESDAEASYAIDDDANWLYNRSASIINKHWLIHIYDENLEFIANL